MIDRLTVTAALVLCAAVAKAQTPGAPSAPGPAAQPVPPGMDANQGRLIAFTNTPFYQGIIKRALASIPAATFEPCPSLVSSSSQMTVFQPLQYNDGGFPIAGFWKQSFPVSGCGPALTLNVFFEVTRERKISVFAGAPGTTHAGPAQQHTAELAAIAGATAALQDQGATPCPSYALKDTSFQAYGLEQPPTADPGPTDRFRPWWEQWTVAGCGRSFDVPLNFIPGASGPPQITQPGHVTQVRIEKPEDMAPNPYALPEPKPSTDAPPAAAKPTDATPGAKP
jgi:hypothetical protein